MKNASISTHFTTKNVGLYYFTGESLYSIHFCRYVNFVHKRKPVVRCKPA